jgi:hypothetical protein
MTEVPARGDIDTGEAGDKTCITDMNMQMAHDMVMTVTPSTTHTANTAALEPVEKNDNMMWMKSEDLMYGVDPTYWRSQMMRTAWQQAHELSQQHQTGVKWANLLQTQSALQEA